MTIKWFTKDNIIKENIYMYADVTTWQLELDKRQLNM